MRIYSVQISFCLLRSIYLFVSSFSSLFLDFVASILVFGSHNCYPRSTHCQFHSMCVELWMRPWIISLMACGERKHNGTSGYDLMVRRMNELWKVLTMILANNNINRKKQRQLVRVRLSVVSSKACTLATDKNINKNPTSYCITIVPIAGGSDRDRQTWNDGKVAEKHLNRLACADRDAFRSRYRSKRTRIPMTSY